ncbi:hypothetical protein PV10_00687 [Exophiala mesophila]|uniref:YDG domain-containing protein n=1 Tax=Exophiala mesophila TaxID=212818 RepID=A0A0D2AD83_EXOME|nr:uncharacterized protein PV10_00687 [Exophiala mesophila]KIV96873.1 hypothetical protein PV10_00687 [Exophiala mesophila]
MPYLSADNILLHNQPGHDQVQGGPGGNSSWEREQSMQDRTRSPAPSPDASSPSNTIEARPSGFVPGTTGDEINLESRLTSLALEPRQGRTLVNLGSFRRRSCICPIDKVCPAKNDNQYDCRSLVREHQEWMRIQNRKVKHWLPTTSDLEEIVGETDAVEFIKLLQKVTVQLAPGQSPRALRNALVNLHRSMDRMREKEMTQPVLDNTHIINEIGHFLIDENLRERRTGFVPMATIEDLTRLHRKWLSGDLGVRANRGLLHDGNGGFSTDPEWPHNRSDDYFGHGHLVPAETWRTRAEMHRDGAHGPRVAGIAGTAFIGARSIVMGCYGPEHNTYADRDAGSTIYYMGTALPREDCDKEPTNVKDPVTYPDGQVIASSTGAGPTSSTRAMIRSSTTGRPVRVFRGSQLPENNPFRPPEGYRYDGLYRVVGFRLLKKERQIYEFTLKRLEDTTGVYAQGPLRHAMPPPKVSSVRDKKRRFQGNSPSPVPRASNPWGSERREDKRVRNHITMAE